MPGKDEWRKAREECEDSPTPTACFHAFQGCVQAASSPSAHGALQTKLNKKGLRYLKIGCGANLSDEAMAVCYTLSMMTNLQPDRAWATGRLDAHCTKGNAMHCGLLAETLLHHGGASNDCSEADASKAARLHKVACENGTGRSCEGLGVMYRDGVGGLPSKAVKARRLFHAACYGADEDPRALSTLRPSCKKKMTTTASACFKLGQSHFTMDTEDSVQKAGAHFSTACEKNDGNGCFFLGNMYLIGAQEANVPDPESRRKAAAAAEGMLSKACALGQSKACARLSEVYASGTEGLKQDTAKAMKFKAQACKAGDEASC